MSDGQTEGTRPEGQNGGSSRRDSGGIHLGDVRLARWLERLVAYIVDASLVSIAGMAIVGGLLTGFAGLDADEISRFAVMSADLDDVLFTYPFAVEFTASGAVMLAYLTAMERFTGTTVGRRIFRLYVLDENGSRPGLGGLLVSNAGKSFILPLDMIIGWIFARPNRQRACARLGGVIVVKTPREAEPSARYRSD